jgi:hypothetical protein
MDETNESTEKQDDKKQDGIEFNEALEALEKRVSDKISDGMSSLESKIVTKPEPDPEPVEDWGDEDDSISKKDLPEIVKKVTEKVSRDTTQKLELATKKQQRDAEAMHDFPELNKNGPNFSKSFHDRVSREITERLQRGRRSDDLDLIYDSAAAVASRGAREGWYVPHSRAEKTNAKKNAKDDSFNVSGSLQAKDGPTEGQVNFAKKVGMSKEKLLQHIEKKR